MSQAETRDRKLIHASAAGWLRRRTVDLAREINDAFLEAHPDFVDRFGAKAKLRGEEDAGFHLHFLAEAILAESAQAFIDYIRWVKILLASRKMPAEDLLRYLQQMRETISRLADYEERELILFFMDAAIADLPTAPNTLPSFISPEKPYSHLANQFLEKLLLMERDVALDVTLREIEGGLSIADLFQHVISPVQREVGRLWQENKITVVQEHYCTASIEILLARIRRKVIGTPRQVSAVTFCAAGEQHCLGVKMFADLLEADGWQVTYLGANVPRNDMLLFLRQRNPDIVAMSVSTALGMTETRELISAIRELPKPPRVLVGGYAIANPAVAKSLGADQFASTLTEGLDIANEWTKQGTA